MKRLAAAFFVAGLLLAGRGAAEEPSFQWFPSENLYTGYIADPRRPEFGVTVLGIPDPQIPDSGDRRVGLKLGGRFGLLRFHGWQLDIEPGFVGQFDIEHSLDNIGWDGIYNFLVSTAVRDDLRVQLGTKHVSSHVGDEYAERTGRRRIDYTREELAAGATWQIHPRWRTYGEIGWGFAPKEEIGQEPGRLQLGLEHEAPGSFGRVGWYAALDLQAMEEKDWQADPTLRSACWSPPETAAGGSASASTMGRSLWASSIRWMRRTWRSGSGSCPEMSSTAMVQVSSKETSGPGHGRAL